MLCALRRQALNTFFIGSHHQVCRISRLAETSATSPQLSARLTSLSSTLATKVPPRVLLPTLTKCYNDMVPAKQVCETSVTVLESSLL